MTTKGGEGIRRLDAGEFYWAMLVLPARREGTYSAGNCVLENLLDTELPVPVERVQAAFVDVGNGRMLACAIDRERLSDLVKDDPSAVVPAGLPLWLHQDLEAAKVELHRLNVLRGDFEPRFVRAAKRRRRHRVCAITGLVLLVAMAGMERRRAAALRWVRVADQRVTSLADELTPKASALPPHLRLAAEARRAAAATEEARESPHPVFDAALQFEGARKLNPDHPVPRVNLGLTFERAGRIEDAIAAYEDALEVQDGYMPAIQALAMCRVRHGRRHEGTNRLLSEIAMRGETEAWRSWAGGMLLKYEGTGLEGGDGSTPSGGGL